MNRDRIQAELDALSAHGGRVILPSGRYDIDHSLVIDTPSLCFGGEVWSYSSDPNGVFVSDFGTQLRLRENTHHILTVGRTRTLGGSIVRDLGFAGNIAGMDTRPLARPDDPTAAAGLVLDAVRTDQCEFSKLSFAGLACGVCATGEAEIDACIFEKINTDGCANGFVFMPRASYYAHFRDCIAADNPYYGFYADGRGHLIHNLELRDMLAVLADDIRHETVTFRKMEATHSYQHPRNLNAVCCAGVELGELGVVYPTISKKIDKKAAIVYAEVDVEKFSAIASRAIAYEEPSRYPEMEVDLTFLTDVYAPIGEAIAKAACPLIRKVSVVGRYEDEAGKTITVRLVFADRTRTLTREEVTAVVDAIVADLAADGISMKL
jgi:hypothetical protein